METLIKKTILHVDINSYFATILQQENPFLRNKPLGVIKDKGRTCLIATSKEAKKLGIETGSRKREALIICPDLICVPATFERYLDVTKRLQKIFKTISPSIYIYSLDEAFIDVSDCRKNLYPDTKELGIYIHNLVKEELGSWVTCNIGIAENRLMAKMASEVAPKGTTLEVTEANKDALLASTPFKDVCGVGYALSKKLKLFNINVPYQIRFMSEEELDVIFGPFWSKELMKIAYGEETHLLSQLDKKIEHMKSVGRSITGYRLYSNTTEISNVLKNLCIEIIGKVRAMNLTGRQVTVGLYGQQKRWSMHITLKTPINHLHDLMIWVDKLYSQWQDKFPVIKFSVRLSLLEKQTQDILLPEWQKQEAIQKSLDLINNKYGIFTVHPAAVPPKNELIFPEVTGFLGDRLYQLGE